MTDEDDDRRDGEDPFEDLSADVGDRSGDPFADLDPNREPTAQDGSAGDGTDSGWHPPGRTDEEWTPRDRDGSKAPAGDLPGPDEPPADVSEERVGDPFESPDSAFQHVDLGDADPDEVWDRLSSAQSRGSVAEARKRTYAEVSKHRFCEQCDHFTGPPEVSCTNEGTDILEFPDMEHVRVVDCPVVAEHQALEEE
ncbi:hypothetical protein ACKVMT_00460 [Halobacteriales archaeon Cl-PHB]